MLMMPTLTVVFFVELADLPQAAKTNTGKISANVKIAFFQNFMNFLLLVQVNK
ncbi:hypothetical protein LPIBR_10344 [Lacticaseibacillus paracasei]|nr:hypothetical protein LPIBR_10344 [Lacticaseibacillus paracasei]